MISRICPNCITESITIDPNLGNGFTKVPIGPGQVLPETTPLTQTSTNASSGIG